MSHTIILPTNKSGSHRDIPLEKSALGARPTDQEAHTGKLLRHLHLANFYVAVKSCPLIILAGPAESGKLTLARLTAHVLGGGQRTSSMPGHARWAAGSVHGAEFVEAQTRLNKSALFALIEEAWQSEQQGLPFVACLQRISPAELDPFFTREGLDHLYRQFLGWRQSSALQLLPLPPNLTLIATIDTERFRWWDTALFDAVTVVPWPAPVPNATHLSHLGQTPLLCSGSFLRHAVRDATAAHERLRQLLPRATAPFARLLQVVGAVEAAGVHVPRTVVNRVTVFAANAWSERGAGLFALDPLTNLDCALQLGIVQYLLPWLALRGHQDVTRARLLPRLDDSFAPLVRLLVA